MWMSSKVKDFCTGSVTQALGFLSVLMERQCSRSLGFVFWWVRESHLWCRVTQFSHQRLRYQCCPGLMHLNWITPLPAALLWRQGIQIAKRRESEDGLQKRCTEQTRIARMTTGFCEGRGEGVRMLHTPFWSHGWENSDSSYPSFLLRPTQFSLSILGLLLPASFN